ncbi:hypothetical protein FQR65_LT17308 [Abscondita terminalis]|nr:hypothetical protein FQR65_LT17308 [Abscondita terminalis]
MSSTLDSAAGTYGWPTRDAPNTRAPESKTRHADGRGDLLLRTAAAAATKKETRVHRSPPSEAEEPNRSNPRPYRQAYLLNSIASIIGAFTAFAMAAAPPLNDPIAPRAAKIGINGKNQPLAPQLYEPVSVFSDLLEILKFIAALAASWTFPIFFVF